MKRIDRSMGAVSFAAAAGTASGAGELSGVDAEAWQRVAVAGAVVVVAVVAARLADRALTRRLRLPPDALTRYRVLRRTIMAVIVALGILSALLVIPAVRAVAGGVLASSAVVGLVVGLAARSTLANFVAGIMIAFTQPLRLGDEVEVVGVAGTVDEIGLTYTTIRGAGGARFFIPNEKLASDTIRNATIAGAEHLAQVRLPVPLASDLERVLTLAEDEARAATESEQGQPTVSVTDFETGETAIVTVEVPTVAGTAAAAESALRRRIHGRLRAEGIF
jgi:small-conductance mechanosensitive channel